MSEEQSEGREGRLARRASYAAALVVSVASIAVSALGLGGALDREPTPSPRVIAAASQVANDDHGSCQRYDDDRREGAKAPSKPKV